MDSTCPSQNIWENEWDDEYWNASTGGFDASTLFEEPGNLELDPFLADPLVSSDAILTTTQSDTFASHAAPGPDVAEVTTDNNDPLATYASLFSGHLAPRTDPPHTEYDRRLQSQKPRFQGDLYTASWVSGHGSDRTGWCGFCSTWHKMKDSAFWYHMHYSHGTY